MSYWWWLASWEGVVQTIVLRTLLHLEICIEIWIDDKYKMDALFSAPWKVNDADPNQRETKFLVRRWSMKECSPQCCRTLATDINKNPEEKGKTTFSPIPSKANKTFQYFILLSFFVAFGAMSDFRSHFSPCVLRVRRFPPKLCHHRSRRRRSPLRHRRAPCRRRQRPMPRGRWRWSFLGISVWPVSNPKKKFGRWPR